METMTMKPREPWPDEVKQTALDIAARESFVAAEAATGVPAATVRSWAHRATTSAGLALPRDGRGVAVPWRERRPVLLDAFGEACSEALQASRKAVKRGNARDAKDLMITSAIAAEKGLLLSGEATTRSESRSAAVIAHARVEALSPEDERILDAQLDADIKVLRAEIELDEGGGTDG
jgi:hypothetical protein